MNRTTPHLSPRNTTDTTDVTMTDNHPNNEKFAPPSVEDEEAAWILLSLKGNNIIDTSNTMSPNTEATQQAAEVRILEHAMVQGAPPIPIPASTNGTPFRLVISSGEQAVQERKASPKPFTNRLSSDVATTSREAQKGIRECVIFSLDRTILAGRADSNLGQKGRKVVVNRARRATNVSIGGQNDAVDIDSNTVFNNAISSRTRAGKLLPNRSNDNSPNTQQRGNAPTMAAAAGPVSLHAESFPLGGGGNSAHKPSIDPFNGAQTITAQRFLQATANTATAGGGARRAHFNNPNELARFSAVAPPVDYKDYAFIEGNGPAAALPSHQPYDAVAAAAGEPNCSTFRPVYIHTAKCDECNTRNKSVLYRCNTCSTQLDRACMTNNHEHGANVDRLDWTDHGAQSASKPRGTAAPRVKKAPAKNVATKKKLSARDEAALEEQLASNDEKDKKKKKKRGANSLSKSTDGAFEEHGFMMLSPRVRIKREDKKARSPPPGNKSARRGAGAEKRKAEVADIYEMSYDNAPKASKAPRRPLSTTGNFGVQSQQRAPAWSESAQSGSRAVPTQNSACSASSEGINSFFAEPDRLREEHTRVTEEIESMKARLTELKAVQEDIEAKIMMHMGN